MFNSLKFKVILFGFIFTFFSSFGQSYFLGLFNSSIRETLSITHGQFGTIYASATLCSSLLLIWVGKKIDDVNIFKFAFFVIILLSFACFFFSKISSVLLFFVAIFLMRFSGQGLMSHTATTAISRYFSKSRGKSLSAIWFGLSSAEFILPILIVFLISLFSWRTVWQFISLFTILTLPLVIFYTIREVTLSSRESNEPTSVEIFNVKQWKRVEVIKDFRFYIISLNMLAMPWIITGVFVYQSFISESKLWDIYTIPKSFMIYSLSSVLTLFFSGFLVDKFTSRRLIPIINIPLLIGLILLYFFDSPLYAFLFFGLVGVSNGLANVLGSSTWAEIYGVRYIGSVKALTTALMVFSTAFGTAFFGYLIDKSYTIETILITCVIYISVSLAILLSIFSKIEPTLIKKA